MFLDKYINIRYFLFSFFIGIFIVYVITPIPEIIIKFPTPDNINTITYKDKSDICYKYRSKEVPCDNKSIETPLQHKK